MKVFLVAGEASGDRLGAGLMAGLKSLAGDVTFEGVGGPLMQAEGMDSLFPMDELSVMGLAEILPQYAHLRRRMIQTAEAACDAKPDVIVTIDSPDFCLRVAERVRRRMRIPTVHYVAPSVWAWRPGRARKMAPHVDRVLAILPFEPPFMEAAGIPCDFVGHPAAMEMKPDKTEAAAYRAAFAPPDAPLLMMLPGSRRSEITRLGPVFGDTLARIREDLPDLRVVIPAATGHLDLVTEIAGDWPGTTILDASEPARKRAAFAAADAALAASGTVSLELAAAGCPMAIAWDTSWLTWRMLKSMVKVDTVTLVNLVAAEKIVPEFLGPDCRPDLIAVSVSRILSNPRAQKPVLDDVMTALGRGGEAPGLRAARAVLPMAGQNT